METGAQINVPLFINTGDKLKVDSRDGSYLGRVNALANPRGLLKDATRPASVPLTCYSKPRPAG